MYGRSIKKNKVRDWNVSVYGGDKSAMTIIVVSRNPVGPLNERENKRMVKFIVSHKSNNCGGSPPTRVPTCHRLMTVADNLTWHVGDDLRYYVAVSLGCCPADGEPSSFSGHVHRT